MAYSVMVIEANLAGEESVREALGRDPEIHLRSLSWDAAVPAMRQPHDSHAVIAVATSSLPTVRQVLEWLRDHPISIPTLAVVPGEADTPLLELALRTSDDFLIAPVRRGELRHRLDRILGRSAQAAAAAECRLREEFGIQQLIGRDPTFQRAVEQIPRFARSGLPVLITGETGTGKELSARAIHHLSPRSESPFLAVDCGAIPDHLFENEMFGHVRGAYTDAHRDQRGLVAMAAGGTLFLDEVDALSLAAQAKLLRFLQERTFRPLGAERFDRADVNVVAASGRDLEDAVRRRQLRSDLYFRLNILRLHLPPLRDRRADIGVLATHFLAEYLARSQATPCSLTSAALCVLGQHDWPGNVRELCNVVQRAAVACQGAWILPCHIELPNHTPTDGGEPASFRRARAAAVTAFERGYVEELLRRHSGNVTHAARDAHKDRRAFGRLVKKHKIDKQSFQG